MFVTPPEKLGFLSTVNGVSLGINNKFLPHVEQLLLDICGSVDIADCLCETLISNKSIAHSTP